MKDEIDSRDFLKGYSLSDIDDEESGPRSDQQMGIEVPRMQNDYPPDSTLYPLIPVEKITLGSQPLLEIIQQRRSRRKFTGEFLTLEELSFLLYTTQGVQKIIKKKDGNPHSSLRTSPSGGARHPFETYLVIQRVESLQPGLYRYLPVDHQICFITSRDTLPHEVSEGCCGQAFAGTAAVIFIWTAVPYRMEWRYLRGKFASKIIAQDSGHLCQNLYLAAESIGCGTCAIGAYIQEKMDALLGVDGVDEFTIYVAPTGKIKKTVPLHLQVDLLQKYTGSFFAEDKPEFVLKTELESERLVLVTMDGSRLNLIPETQTKFIIELAESTITFLTDGQNNVVGIELDQAGEIKKFRQ